MTTTGTTVADTTGASTLKGAADSDLQVWTPFLLPVSVCVSVFSRLASELRCLDQTGESQLTEPPPPRTIPDGCYDCGDGFYDPRTRVVTSYEGGFLRSAGQAENVEAYLHSKEDSKVVGGACDACKCRKWEIRENKLKQKQPLRTRFKS